MVPPEPLVVAGDLGSGTVKKWAERIAIDAPDVETLLRYPASADWLDNAPAVISRKVGRGRVTYSGAWLDDAALARVLAWSAAGAGAAPLLANLPAGVEVSAREAGTRRLHIVINWAQEARSVTLPTPTTDLIGGKVPVSQLTLAPYGVAVLATP